MLTDSEEVVFKNTPEYINIFGELAQIIKKANTNKEVRKKEFIILNTSDGCFLPALIQHADQEKNAIIIFIHGSGGNFFKANYYEDMFEEFNYNGYDFMIANNRGSEQFFRLHRKTAGVTETIKAGNIYENFDESIYDVSAAVNFAKERGYNDIILIGQSLGTLKVQYYSEVVGDINKIVLLSPVDMVSRFRSRVGDNYQNIIVQSMAIGSKADLFKMEEDRDISIPLNYKGNVSVVVGSNEHVYKGWDMFYIDARLRARFKNAKYQVHVIPNSTHDYHGYEKQMAKLVIDSINNMK